MLSKRNNLFPCLIIFLIVIAIFIGCSSNEEKARKVYNEAITAEQNGDNEKAIELYDKIVKNFPETETAIKSNEKLSIIKIFTNAAKEDLEKARQELRKDLIESSLKLYKLDNGTYPSTQQGIQALVEKPTSGKTPQNWRPGGYLKKSNLECVESYSLSDDGLNFTLIMK